MTFEKVVQTVGPNGKAIVDRLVVWKEQRKDIEFSETEVGFHVCLRTKQELIPLIQVWGKLNQPTSQVIETRKQWFPNDLELTKDEEKDIFLLFRKANFKRTSGPYLNLRFSFGEEKNPFLKVGPTQLDNLEKALNRTIEIINNYVR